MEKLFGNFLAVYVFLALLCLPAFAKLQNKSFEAKPNASSADTKLQEISDREIFAAKDLIHAHKYAQAVVKLSELVKKYPNDAALEEIYAELLRDLGQVDLASEEFRKVAILRPNDSTALIELSKLALQKMELESSLDYAHQAVARNPLSLDANLVLIEVLLQCDLTSEAERALKGLRYESRDSGRVEQLAYRLSLKKGDLVAARVHLRNAIGSTVAAPSNTQLHLEQSELLQSMGDRRAAREELRSILEKQPDSVTARLRLARLLETEYYDYAAALENYDEALKIDPLSAQAIAGHDRCEAKKRNIALQLKMAFKQFLASMKQQEDEAKQADQAAAASHIPN